MSDRPVRLAQQVPPARVVRKDLPDRLVPPERMEQMEAQAPPVQWDRPARQARLEQSDPWVRAELREVPARLAQRVHPELAAPLARPARPDRLERLAHQELTEQMGRLAQRARPDLPARLDRMAAMGQRAPPALPDRKA